MLIVFPWCSHSPDCYWIIDHIKQHHYCYIFPFLWFLLIFIFSSLTCVQFKTLKFLLCLSLEIFFTNFFIFDCTVLLSWWQIEVLPTLGWLPKTFYFFQSPTLIFIRTFKLLSILVKFLHPVFKLKQLDKRHPCKYSDR